MATALPDTIPEPDSAMPDSDAPGNHPMWGTSRPSKQWETPDEDIYRAARSANRLSIVHDLQFRHLLHLHTDLVITEKPDLMKRDMLALRDLHETANEAAELYEDLTKQRWHDEAHGQDQVVCLASRAATEMLHGLTNQIQANGFDLKDVRVIVKRSSAWQSTKAALSLQNPNVIWVDEFSSQINSVVKFYFGAAPVLARVADAADFLIRTLKTEEMYEIVKLLHCADVLDMQELLLSPSTSSWTAHYWGYKGLLKASTGLRRLADDWDGTLLAGKMPGTFVLPDPRSRAVVLQYLSDPNFWEGLKRLCMHLKPLAMAASIVNMPNSCSPDRVLITLHWLSYQYFEMRINNPTDNHIPLIISAIDSVWASCDQDLYIAALGLHPFHKTEEDHELQLVSNTEFRNICIRLYPRLMGEAPPAKFFQDLDAWIFPVYDGMARREVDEIELLRAPSKFAHRSAKLQGKYPDALRIYDIAYRRHEPLSAFQRFTYRVLSVPAIAVPFTDATFDALSAQLYPFIRRGEMSEILKRTLARILSLPSTPPDDNQVPTASTLQEIIQRFDPGLLSNNGAGEQVPLRGKEVYRSLLLRFKFGPAVEHAFKQEMAWHDLLALGSIGSWFDPEDEELETIMGWSSEAESDDEACEEVELDA
ncbi:hypothetical protein FA95DRAFT_1575398 [Auriscalpium vulgare]|uniref:Uncharacterized protein n=1 Tax=Auriscalpium vulgare TaxID=40419 RepID=A0ACB8RH00_9AGAM|nr:hypothetical protein FA95DRAFT_1575398 [Auriscalpium vulgare]